MSQDSARASNGRLRILYVATKPAYPPRDGGRLLIWNTLTELASRGHRITYVAPDLGHDTAIPRRHLEEVCETVNLVSARPRSLWYSAAAAAVTRKPLSMVRHFHRAVQSAIEDELDRQRHDVIHAEQIQAFSNLPANGDRPPLVLRAQNVESELWRMVSLHMPRAAWIARDEARKMAALEAVAVRRSGATIVLTHTDAETLGGGTGPKARRISVVRPPFPTTLPSCEEPLAGDPPVVLVTGGWLPNRDSLEWFLREVWPAILEANPAARAHIFGGSQPDAGPSVAFHPSPPDSVRLFRPDSVLVVPLRIASGIRMKILEAWARGVPVVATPTAVRGLDDVGGNALLLAGNGAEFGEAIARLRQTSGLREELVDSGRRTLALQFKPNYSADRLEEVYRKVIAELT